MVTTNYMHRMFIAYCSCWDETILIPNTGEEKCEGVKQLRRRTTETKTLKAL
jgi:hypothetical protein